MSKYGGFRSLQNFITKPFRLGFEGERLHHQNRLTLITNALALLAIVGSASHVSTMLQKGIHPALVFGALADIMILSPLVLFANYKHWHAFARYTTITATFVVGLRAYAVAGRTLNAQYIIFIGIVLSLISFNRDQKKLQWTSLAIVLLGLPLGEFLVEHGHFPLMTVDWGFPIRFMDAIFMPLGVAVCVLMQRILSEEYSYQLERFNETLENKVEERTRDLFQAKQEVEQASLLKTQFVTNTSHELRTPVQGIFGYLQLMERKVDRLSPENLEASREKILKSINNIKKSNDRLSDLIHRLLDMTRLHSGDFQLQPSEFSFTELVKDQIRPRQEEASNKGITFQGMESMESHGPLYQDRTLVEQIVSHLISNAVRYADSGSQIHFQFNSGSGYMEWRIQNQGPGIEDSDLEKVFEPFVQGLRTDQSVGGTGLGLSFCRKYSALLGGDVVIEDSRPDSTVFLLRLPLSLDSSETYKKSG